MNTISRERIWIETVSNLAHRYKCWREYNDEAEMRKLKAEQRVEKKNRLSFGIGRINDKIRLLDTVMQEHEYTSKALYEYAGILSRLMECREKIIPHKHDAEIIDYIATGARYDDTRK